MWTAGRDTLSADPRSSSRKLTSTKNDGSTTIIKRMGIGALLRKTATSKRTELGGFGFMRDRKSRTPQRLIVLEARRYRHCGRKQRIAKQAAVLLPAGELNDHRTKRRTKELEEIQA
jgi:hypothetical protein